MDAFDNLKTCLSLLFERKYFFDKWIGDESLLSILLNEYNLVDVDKKYLNQHILKTTNLFMNSDDNFRKNTFKLIPSRKSHRLCPTEQLDNHITI